MNDVFLYLAAIPVGIFGVVIIVGINRSEQLGKPANRLIAQLKVISFPGVDEDQYPYAGAGFIGLLFIAIGLTGIATLLFKILAT